jgi:hypothetical protein
MLDSASAHSALDEIGSILAAGLQRLLDRKSSPISARGANSSLDCEAPAEGDVANKSEDIAP